MKSLERLDCPTGRSPRVAFADPPHSAVLDIGGEPVVPSFSDAREVPPIPCHIHSGDIVVGADGKRSVKGPVRCSQCRSDAQGKLEAYYFPPVDVPPLNLKPIECKTRLGLKPSTKREEVAVGAPSMTPQLVQALKQFGKSDVCYSLLNTFSVSPHEGWTIPTGFALSRRLQ